MPRSPLRVCEQLRCSYQLNAPSDVFLLLGRLQEFEKPRTAKDESILLPASIFISRNT